MSAPKKSQYVCPHCDRVIYNRLLKACEFCGATLPAQLVYSDAEKAALQRKWADEARKRREEQSAQDLADGRRNHDSGSDVGLFTPPFDLCDIGGDSGAT